MKIQFQSGKKSRKEKNRPPPKIEKLRNIPTLFDPEISRRPTVPTLPDLQDTKNVILMSINLATLGCALMNHNGRNTVVDSQCPKFGLSFPMLVTWLLRYFAHVSDSMGVYIFINEYWQNENKVLGVIFFENKLLLQSDVVFDSESNGRNFSSLAPPGGEKKIIFNFFFQISIGLFK